MKDKNLKIENKLLHFTLLAPYAKRSFVILGSFSILTPLEIFLRHFNFRTYSQNFINYQRTKLLKYLFLTGLIFTFFIFTTSAVFASETNGTMANGGNNGYGWSDRAGWVNFGCANCGISIADSGIAGYAWSPNYGWINMKPANGGVMVAADGALSGYAWGSSLGWINFSGASVNSSGKIVGQALGANIGALTFDCANCSVATDFRAQNFRTVAPIAAPLTAVAGGGGGGGGISYVSGPVGQPVPAHISAFNVPMRLYPAQSGILMQGLTNQKSVILDVPTNVFFDEVTFVVEEETFSITPTAEIQFIGNALFNVFAMDKNGNQARTFENPIKITFIVPGSLRGRSDLAVYFFDPVRSRPAEDSATSALGRSVSNGVDETARAWIKIPDAVFSGDSVSFSVDHLTLFAIFAGPELPLAAAPTFPVQASFEFAIPRPEIGAPGKEQVLEEEVPAEKILEENPPLFDIEVNPGPPESKRTRTFIVLVVLIIAAGGATFYFFRRMRKNQQ